MTIHKKYVVYSLNNILGSPSHQSLERVEFKEWKSKFDTEEEAIQALIDENKTWENYLILTEVYIN